MTELSPTARLDKYGLSDVAQGEDGAYSKDPKKPPVPPAIKYLVRHGLQLQSLRRTSAAAAG